MVGHRCGRDGALVDHEVLEDEDFGEAHELTGDPGERRQQLAQHRFTAPGVEGDQGELARHAMRVEDAVGGRARRVELRGREDPLRRAEAVRAERIRAPPAIDDRRPPRRRSSDRRPAGRRGDPSKIAEHGASIAPTRAADPRPRPLRAAGARTRRRPLWQDGPPMKVVVSQFEGIDNTPGLPLAAGCIVAAAKQAPALSAARFSIHVQRQAIDRAVAAYGAPDVLGFSLYPWNAAYSLDVARAARRRPSRLSRRGRRPVGPAASGLGPAVPRRAPAGGRAGPLRGRARVPRPPGRARPGGGPGRRGRHRVAAPRRGAPHRARPRACATCRRRPPPTSTARSTRSSPGTARGSRWRSSRRTAAARSPARSATGR